MLKFGIYRSPIQWVEKSLMLQHPFDNFHAVPDQMLDVLFYILTTAPADVCKFRISKLKLWMKWAEELDTREKEHKQRLDPEVGRVLAPKRLLLLRKIADSLDWPDTQLFDEIDEGFKLIGIQDPSNIFGLEPRPPQSSEGELWANAKFIRPALIGKVKIQILMPRASLYGMLQWKKQTTITGCRVLIPLNKCMTSLVDSLGCQLGDLESFNHQVTG